MRERPAGDEVKFGGGWAVTMGAEVEADPFYAVEEEVAFLGIEGEAPFGEDVANAREVEDEGDGIVGEEQNVVNDLVVASLNQMNGDGGCVDVRELCMEECLPFLAKEEHEGGVASRSVDGSKGHDVECVKDALGPDKAEFVPIGMANGDLMEARFGIDADPV